MLKRVIEIDQGSIWVDERDEVIHQIKLCGSITSSCPVPKLLSHSKLSTEIFEYLIRKRNQFSSFNLYMDSFSPFLKATSRAMLEIPYGETVSYGQLAASIGSPRGSRAIGNACGANQFPIVVPCHRIIKSNGTIGGFSAHIGWKSFLHRLEAIECKISTKVTLETT